MNDFNRVELLQTQRSLITEAGSAAAFRGLVWHWSGLLDQSVHADHVLLQIVVPSCFLFFFARLTPVIGGTHTNVGVHSHTCCAIYYTSDR